MTKEQIVEGRVYHMRHSSGFINVKVESIFHLHSGKSRYTCTNLKTGRTIMVKSAAKFRHEVADCA